MMISTKTLLYIISAVILFTGGMITDHFAFHMLKQPQKTGETPTKNEWKDVSTTTREYIEQSCGRIGIHGEWKDHKRFGVIAENGCERATKDFMLELPSNYIIDIYTIGLILGGVYNSKGRMYPTYGIEVDYQRFWGHIGLGGGAWYSQSMKQSEYHDFGIKVLASVKINK